MRATRPSLQLDLGCVRLLRKRIADGIIFQCISLKVLSVSAFPPSSTTASKISRMDDTQGYGTQPNIASQHDQRRAKLRGPRFHLPDESGDVGRTAIPKRFEDGSSTDPSISARPSRSGSAQFAPGHTHNIGHRNRSCEKSKLDTSVVLGFNLRQSVEQDFSGFSSLKGRSPPQLSPYAKGQGCHRCGRADS